MVSNNLNEGFKQKITQKLVEAGMEERKARGLVFGADLYYQRPLGFTALVEIINNLI